MKKKVLLSAFAVICLAVCALLLCGCAEEHIHAFGEWTVVKKPTCTENGEQECLCTCGEKQTQTIPATGHTFGEWQTSKEPTCTEAGEEERLCSCGERQTQTIAATGVHIYGEWQISKEPTCTEAGEEECLCACGERQTRTVAAKGHSFGEWKTVKAVTCTESGTQERTCKCGEKQTQTIAATGHTFSAWKTVKAATCTSDGTQERTCKCGEKQTQTISATGHSWKAATCTEPKTCTKCKITEGKALGHDYVKSITKNATCTSAGEEKYTCSRCGDSYTKKITASHEFVDGVCKKCSTLDDYTGAIIVAIKGYFQQSLKNPTSLQLHSVEYVVGSSDKNYIRVDIIYSAMNGFGGYNRDIKILYLKLNGDGTFTYSPYSSSTSATSSYSNTSVKYNDLSKFTNYYFS